MRFTIKSRVSIAEWTCPCHYSAFLGTQQSGTVTLNRGMKITGHIKHGWKSTKNVWHIIVKLWQKVFQTNFQNIALISLRIQIGQIALPVSWEEYHHIVLRRGYVLNWQTLKRETNRQHNTIDISKVLDEASYRSTSYRPSIRRGSLGEHMTERYHITFIQGIVLPVAVCIFREAKHV